MLSAAGRTQLLYGIVQDGLLPVGKFDGVVDFGCTVYQGESFRALRGRHYRLDTKNLTFLFRAFSHRAGVILDVILDS